jgi:hypothetical protein
MAFITCHYKLAVGIDMPKVGIVATVSHKKYYQRIYEDQHTTQHRARC